VLDRAPRYSGVAMPTCESGSEEDPTDGAIPDSPLKVSSLVAPDCRLGHSTGDLDHRLDSRQQNAPQLLGLPVLRTFRARGDRSDGQSLASHAHWQDVRTRSSIVVVVIPLWPGGNTHRCLFERAEGLIRATS
jgi:hypothetical protein